MAEEKALSSPHLTPPPPESHMHRAAARAGWLWPVLVLAFCHADAIASFQVLSVLVDPIKASIRVTDTQYSLMQGFAVAVFASLFGMPAAAVADRGRRRLVVVLGVVIWSLATLACGFSRNFAEFFGARMLVGLGEVFLFPAALSIIAATAPPNRLASAIGLFGCGGPIGTALALAGGGRLVQAQTQLATWAPFGETWRLAFVACSAAGVLAVLLLATVGESRRDTSTSGSGAGFGAAAAHLIRHFGAYGGVVVSMVALSYCVFAAAAWGPTVLVRGHEASYAVAGAVTGAAALAGGVTGTWLIGLLTDWVGASGRRDAALLVSTGVAVAIPLTICGAVFWASPTGAAAFLAATYCLLGMPTVLAATALQQISPREFRARVMALQVMMVNLVALSLGPSTVAVLTDRVFGTPGAVGPALAITVSFGGVVAAAGLFASRETFIKSRSA